MKDSVMLAKVEPFLADVHHQLTVMKVKKLAIRHMLTKHKMSESAREALYRAKIVAKKGYGRQTEYKWIAGKLTDKVSFRFLTEIREINKGYNQKNPKPKPVYKEPKESKPTISLLLPAALAITSVFILKNIFRK